MFVITDPNTFSSYRQQWREVEEAFEKLVRLTKLLLTINYFNNCFNLEVVWFYSEDV